MYAEQQLMYDGHQMLAVIDSHRVGILALCALAMVFNYTWFFAAYVIAWREKVYSVPIFCTLFWFAGDGTFVARYHTWFNTYHHWYVELFWGALLFTVTFEVLYIVQAVRYARKELLPSSTPRQFAALIVAGAAAAVIVWNLLNNSMGDPLAIAYFTVANTALPLMYIGILMRRRSSAGTAPVVWWGYLGMITCWFTALAAFYGPQFRSFWYLALWAVCTVGGIGVLIAVKRLPKTPPQPATVPSTYGVSVTH